MGTFDAGEHERREEMITAVDISDEGHRATFDGEVMFVGEDSVEDLLSTIEASMAS